MHDASHLSHDRDYRNKASLVLDEFQDFTIFVVRVSPWGAFRAEELVGLRAGEARPQAIMLWDRHVRLMGLPIEWTRTNARKAFQDAAKAEHILEIPRCCEVSEFSVYWHC